LDTRDVDSTRLMRTRREFAKVGAICAGAFLSGMGTFAALMRYANVAQGTSTDPFSGGKQTGLVDFINQPDLEMESAQGVELDGRLYTDLTAIPLDTESVATEKFYLRTRASKLLPEAKLWRVTLNGRVDKPRGWTIEEMKRLAKPQGLHLMECAGNVPLVKFGLISAADWAGVPLLEILDGVSARLATSRVLVTGFDEYATPSRTSIPGASWIFTAKELKDARAFLATEMNGEPLTADHGAPVRLVVPGWYGCTCIKWVQKISLVSENAEATSQMREYAARTHQKGMPGLAREFQPATIDPAAMPIRIEKWAVGEKIKYRVVGIAWGGTAPVKNLVIRFNPEEEYVPVDQFSQTKNDPWTFWTHAWSPKEPGTYSIRLMVKDQGVRTRRLDSGYYVRSVEISEI